MVSEKKLSFSLKAFSEAIQVLSHQADQEKSDDHVGKYTLTMCPEGESPNGHHRLDQAQQLLM